MKKILAAISLTVLILACLFFVRFDAVEGEVNFADQELNYVKSRVVIAADGRVAKNYLVNIRLIYDSNALCPLL